MGKTVLFLFLLGANLAALSESVCTLNTKQEDKFRFKHLDDTLNIGTAAAALAKSCSRNHQLHDRRRFATNVNTVYFDRTFTLENLPGDTTSCIADPGNAWNCPNMMRRGRTEVVCNRGPNPCHVINCPRASAYRIKIAKNSGHLYHDEYQYCDVFAEGNDCWTNVYNDDGSLACHED